MNWTSSSEPEPVKSGVFIYDKQGIRVKEHSRAPLDELKLLFRKNASKARIRSATRPWVTVQLHLYGIPFQAKDSKVQLMALLETSVKNGQCNSPPPAIIALEKSLSIKYQQAGLDHEGNIKRRREIEFAQLKSPSLEASFDTNMFLAKYFLTGPHGQPDREKQKEALILDCYLRDDFLAAVQEIPGLVAHKTRQVSILGWEDTISRGIDAAFARLSASGHYSHIATDEMHCDLDRFMAKYFLDGIKGKPNPEKTPNPIELLPYLQEWPRLATTVASVPGLHVARVTEKSPFPQYTIIGWDADKVTLCKKRLEEKQAQEELDIEAERQAEEEEARQRVLAPHRLYLSNHAASPGPLKLEDLTGSYIIECEAAEQYINDGDNMTLDCHEPASAHGVVAAFRFGFIEGTMLLALSPDALHTLREEQPVMEDDSENDSDDEYGDYDSDTRKRKAGNSIEGRVIKRRLGETPKPNRVYLQWAGREIENAIAVDEENEHIGYLDFDPSKATAKGELAYPSLSREKFRFSIYKRADEPDEDPRDWGYFTEKQYNYECSARWGGR